MTPGPGGKALAFSMNLRVRTLYEQSADNPGESDTWILSQKIGKCMHALRHGGETPSTPVVGLLKLLYTPWPPHLQKSNSGFGFPG